MPLRLFQKGIMGLLVAVRKWETLKCKCGCTCTKMWNINLFLFPIHALFADAFLYTVMYLLCKWYSIIIIFLLCRSYMMNCGISLFRLSLMQNICLDILLLLRWNLTHWRIYLGCIWLPSVHIEICTGWQSWQVWHQRSGNYICFICSGLWCS